MSDKPETAAKLAIEIKPRDRVRIVARKDMHPTKAFPNGPSYSIMNNAGRVMTVQLGNILDDPNHPYTNCFSCLNDNYGGWYPNEWAEVLPAEPQPEDADLIEDVCLGENHLGDGLLQSDLPAEIAEPVEGPEVDEEDVRNYYDSDGNGIAGQWDRCVSGYRDWYKRICQHFQNRGFQMGRAEAQSIVINLHKQLEKDEQDCLELIDERDAWHDCVDKIADILGDKTEWSSANDRGQNAIELAEFLTAELDRLKSQPAPQSFGKEIVDAMEGFTEEVEQPESFSESVFEEFKQRIKDQGAANLRIKRNLMKQIESLTAELRAMTEERDRLKESLEKTDRRYREATAVMLAHGWTTNEAGIWQAS